MRLLWYFAVVAIVLTFVQHVRSEEEEAAEASSVSVVEAAAEPATLVDVDAGVKDEGELIRESRQFRTFGFGRPYYGGGFYRPRPFYGGGFYGPRPYYGGGFYRPRPYYGGGFYRPRPYYGGFYG